jgi:hypothetical protein
MKFDILKTRRGKLSEKLKNEIEKPTSNLENILIIIDDYEKNNLETIDKLKKDKLYETKRISGALKQTINAHGPITSVLIGSATKRIHGALLNNGLNKHNHYIKIHKSTLMLGVMFLIAISVFVVLIK